MKNILTICSLLFVSASINAQITFWGVGVKNVYDSVAQTYKFDPFSPCIVDQYDYDDVDMISSQQEKWSGDENYLTYLCLWKNGQSVWKGSYSSSYLYINDDSFMSHLGYAKAGVDSIVWHPYALKDVALPVERDTIPVVELYGSNDRTYSLGMDPHYATISYGISYSDTSIVNASIEKVGVNRRSAYFRNEYTLIISPKKVGKTVLTLTFNNSIHKQLEIVVNPSPGVQDETSLPIDSLFNKIYSRLVFASDVFPQGTPDFTGADFGCLGFARVMFLLQELGADHLFWIWDDRDTRGLVTNSINAESVATTVFFHRLYYNIWLCNSYLTRTEHQEALAIKRAEVRFLRAYFYYYLLDMFGNVPIVTNNPDFLTTPQSTRKQLYDFIESELLAVEPDLSAVGYKEDYYRVDKAAAWLLLSRLYLNAPVYYSANTQFDKAAQYAYKVIQSSYGLATNYKWLFMGDNDKKSSTNDAWKEMILPIGQDGEKGSYTGSMYLVSSMADMDSPYMGSGEWHALRSRAQLVDLFFADPVNAAQGTAAELPIAAGDDRALFCNSYNGVTWRYNGGFRMGDNRGMKDGWVIQKWTNWKSDSTLGSNQTFPDTDIPLMRKAEAYLNYAEAVVRGGTQVGNLTALEAVNILRRRAHASEVQSLDLDFILDERGREFYAEGYRRSDLIRFGKYGGNNGYQWECKSGISAGKDFPQYMNLYPLPASLLPSMYNGQQNPGY